MARVRRNWTSAEDELLRRAVRKAEEEHRPLLWRELAKAVPGRSNKDCRRRWWNSLSEGNAKGPWTEEEDERLTAAVQKHGTNWTLVSREVKSRSSDQCSSHWSHVLDPNINYCDWDEQEDSDLLHQVHTYGTKWAYIASIHTPVRTTLALKNRYSTLRLKSENKNRSRQGSSSTEASWSRAASAETAMTSPQGHWSPDNHHVSNWTGSSDPAKFGGDMECEETEDEDEDHERPQDLPTWPLQSSKAETTTSMPFIQASFASWDAWARLNDVTCSDGTHTGSCHITSGEGAHMQTEDYYPLASPMMMSRPGHPASSMSDYCFFGGEETRPTGQDSIYPLYDDETCRKLSPGATSPQPDLAVTPAGGNPSDASNGTDALAFPGAKLSLAPSTASPVTNALGGTAGTAAGAGRILASETSGGWASTATDGHSSSTSPSTPLWSQFSRTSSLDSLLSSPSSTASSLRVSISMTCHPGQLANVMTQMSNYGSGVTVNVQPDE